MYLKNALLLATPLILAIGCKDKKPADDGLPKISNTKVAAPNHTKASVSYDITDAGSSAITETGVVYSTSASPTISDTKIVASGSAVGTYTVGLSGLTTNTKYYVKAFATNAKGTAYGAEINFTTQQIKLGDKYAGGIVIYLDNSGLHGLVSAEQGIGLAGKWGCKGTSVPGTSTALGTGQANTNAILAVCKTAGIAAQLANDLVTAGYSDWYLPSADEMKEMYKFRVQIGFNSNNRWSSTESDANTAYSQSFDPAATTADILNKDENHGVRPIRTF